MASGPAEVRPGSAPESADGTASALSPWRTPRWWGTTAIAVLAVLVCVGLGAWQFDRARTRDRPTVVVGTMDRPAAPLASAVPADGRVPAGSPPAAVRAAGRYDGEHQLLVPGRVQDGNTGSYVVTPLRLASGSAALVVRGWVPAGTPAPPAADAPVSVLGWLVPSEPLSAATVDPLRLGPGQVASVSAARIAGLVPYPVIDGYVGLVEQTPEGSAGLTPLPVPQAVPTAPWSLQSLSYAMEWWFFALVGVWMWWQALRIERGRSRSLSVAPHDPGLDEEDG